MGPLVSQAFRTLVLVFNQSRQDSAQIPSLPPVLFLPAGHSTWLTPLLHSTCSWGGVQSSSNHFSHCLYDDMYDIMYDAKIHEKSNSKEKSTITQSLGVQSIMVVRAWPLEYGRLVTPLFDRMGDPGP